jgi:cytoskeletal protein CcmA (bactofilin family)
MPFGFGKSSRRHFADLPGNWVGWLEPGVEVEGRITVTSGLIRINTHVKGEVLSEGTVVVHDQGEVEGEVHSPIVSVTGKIKGAIRASERLEIKEHGVVLGDIYTPCLVIDPGGYFDGQCHMPTPEPAPQTPNDADVQKHL